MVVYKYLDKLHQLQLERKSSLAQKQVAAWGAVVLFLSILFVLINKYETLEQVKKMYKCGIVVLTIILAILFCLFIHQQYSSIFASMAINKAINKIEYSTIKYNKLPKYINTSDVDSLISSLKKKDRT